MDVLKLRATLGLDKKDYEEGLNDAENKASSSGGRIGGLLVGTAKMVGAGIAATTTAVAGLVKSSVGAYSEYEQLTGGVETLFGTSYKTLKEYAEAVGKDELEVAAEMGDKMRAQAEVMDNAANAYKTAGLNANEYMETVTGMAAALKQSTETSEDAAKKADQAIVDMSDNANKMGTSMEMIQNAYNGFAKGNFMMLDNLKIGYGGTKEEMQRLLADAEKLSGVHYDLSSYADIVDAIHVVQTEMGITGTTAKEASTTIQGSLSMVGAAWQNLVTGITNPDADISKLIGDLVDSGKAAASNLIPAIGQALKGVGELVQGIAPVISDELPALINSDLLPMLLDAGITLFNGLIDALPGLMDIIFNELPTIISAVVEGTLKLLPMIIELGLQLIMALANGIMEALPELIPALVDTILQIVNYLTNPSNLTMLIEAAIAIILALANGLIDALPQLIEAIPVIVENLVTALVDNLPLLIDATILLIGAIAKAIIENLPLILAAAVKIVFAIGDGLIKALPDLLAAGFNLMTELLGVIIESFPVFLANGIKLVGSFVEGIVNTIGSVIQAGIKLLHNLVDAIVGRYDRIKQAGQNAINSFKDGIMDKINDAKTWGKDLIQNFIDGILAKWNDLKNTVSDIAGSIRDRIGFSEPKLGPLSNFHSYAPDMMDLFIKGVKDNGPRLLDTVQKTFNFQDLISSPVINLDTETGKIGYNSIRENNSNRDIYDMLEQITEMLPMLADRQIVLDTGVLVGQTVDKYDDALGKLLSNKQRSV